MCYGLSCVFRQFFYVFFVFVLFFAHPLPFTYCNLTLNDKRWVDVASVIWAENERPSTMCMCTFCPLTVWLCSFSGLVFFFLSLACIFSPSAHRTCRLEFYANAGRNCHSAAAPVAIVSWHERIALDRQHAVTFVCLSVGFTLLVVFFLVELSWTFFGKSACLLFGSSSSRQQLWLVCERLWRFFVLLLLPARSGRLVRVVVTLASPTNDTNGLVFRGDGEVLKNFAFVCAALLHWLAPEWPPWTEWNWHKNRPEKKPNQTKPTATTAVLLYA